MSTDTARMIAKSAQKFDDPAERAAYLDRVCHGIARLRADVERHLAEMETSGAASEAETSAGAGRDPAPAAERTTHGGGATQATPRADDGRTDDGDADDRGGTESSQERAGDRIGRYRLVKELGEGGFGTVWLAEQLEPVKRSVALKIIKLGMDTLQVVARFEQERQALALMDHPNVARVLDAGATSNGRPFFVMDLVPGKPINEYCDEERLDVSARIELFTQVCNAVQHAHMKGIIHRDLKPSNVLVTTRDGKPHATVIDFGIAKATSSKLTDRSLVTEAYQVIGTLQYMSPEQSQASPDIDTRTDVYSLGMILYELLTGATPYDGETFQRAVLADILRMISEQDAPPPSSKVSKITSEMPAVAEARRADPRRLATSLSGELDWIVLRAIEKDRDRRYESAEAFAADLRRHLAGEEVVAAPPSAAYRFRKLVRRHRGMFFAAGAVAASLLAGVVAFAWQANVAANERDDAVKARKAEEIERKRAESVAGFMETVFKGLDPSLDEAANGSFREQLVARVESMAGEFEKLDADPLGRARIEATFANTLAGLGEYEKALVPLRSALALRKAASGDAATDVIDIELALAFYSAHAGHFDDGFAMLDALQNRLAARGAIPSATQTQIDEARAFLLSATGRPAEALPFIESVCRAADAAGGLDTGDRLASHHSLGVAYREVGRIDDAVRVLTDVLARRRALLGVDSATTLNTANSLAVALDTAGKSAEALALYEDTRNRVAKRYAADHPMTLTANMNYAGALQRHGRAAEGIAILEEQAARAEAKFGPVAPTTLQLKWGVLSIHAESGNREKALAGLAEVVGPMSRVWGPEHPTVRGARSVFSRLGAEAGNGEPARKFLEAEIARVSADPAFGGPDARAAVRLRAELALHLIRMGKVEAGTAQLDALAPVMESVLGTKDDTRLSIDHSLGLLYLNAQQPKEAIAALRRALDARTAALGPDDPQSIDSQHAFGVAHWTARDFNAAVTILTDALSRAERVLGADKEPTLLIALDLGVNLIGAGREDDFLAAMSKWLPIAQTKLGRVNSNVVQLTDTYGGLCAQRERAPEAAAAMEFLRDAVAAESGPDSEDALTLTSNSAAFWWKAGRLDKSIPMFEDLVARLTRLQGESAAATLMAAANLAVNLRDANRTADSIALFEKTLALARAAGPSAAPAVTFATGEYARTLVKAGRREEGIAIAQDVVAQARRRASGGGLALGNELGAVAPMLVDAELWEIAEPVFREMVAIRERAAPNAWNHWNARGLLGEALLRQKKFAEAEEFVVKGYEGLAARENSIPPVAQHWIPKARDRVLRLYEAWDAAEPGKGYDAKRSEWKTKFDSAAKR